MDSNILDNIIKQLKDEIEEEQYYIDEQMHKIRIKEILINDREIIIKKLEELK